MSKLENLRQKITDLLMPIQTGRIISAANFKDVQQAVEQLSLELKGVDLVSKSLLNEVYVTIKILRAESLNFSNGESALMEEMANNLEFIFELILKNETLDQRKPGVPRIL